MTSAQPERPRLESHICPRRGRKPTRSSRSESKSPYSSRSGMVANPYYLPCCAGTRGPCITHRTVSTCCLGCPHCCPGPVRQRADAEVSELRGGVQGSSDGPESRGYRMVPAVHGQGRMPEVQGDAFSKRLPEGSGSCGPGPYLNSSSRGLLISFTSRIFTPLPESSAMKSGTASGPSRSNR